MWFADDAAPFSPSPQKASGGEIHPISPGEQDGPIIILLGSSLPAIPIPPPCPLRGWSVGLSWGLTTSPPSSSSITWYAKIDFRTRRDELIRSPSPPKVAPSPTDRPMHPFVRMSAAVSVRKTPLAGDPSWLVLDGRSRACEGFWGGGGGGGTSFGWGPKAKKMHL